MVDVVGKRNHMASLRESDVSSEKWPKFTSFHLILQQYWNWKIVVNAINREEQEYLFYPTT